MSMRRLYALLLAISFTVLFATFYIVVQQYGRSSANDAPTSLAESIAAEIKNPANQATLPLGKLDIATSLQPFVDIYNQNYRPLAGTGYLHGTLPTIDKGILRSATTGHDHAVTWEPKSGTRIAAVVVKSGNYYVLGGQSLRLTESRADLMLKLTALGWLICMACIAAGYWALNAR